MLFGYNWTLVVIRRKLIIVKQFIFGFFPQSVKNGKLGYYY